MSAAAMHYLPAISYETRFQDKKKQEFPENIKKSTVPDWCKPPTNERQR